MQTTNCFFPRCGTPWIRYLSGKGGARRKSQCIYSFLLNLQFPLLPQTNKQKRREEEEQREKDHECPWSLRAFRCPWRNQKVSLLLLSIQSSFSFSLYRLIFLINFEFVLYTNILNQFRVSYERDTKIINAASFTIEREDHTIGNILRMYVFF
jgi:hypothetical protein